MTSSPLPPASPPSIIGAVVYGPDHRPESLLADFARALTQRGFKVGGVVQETTDDDMVLVDLSNGERLSIKQNLGSGSAACSLDESALAQASGGLRRAVADRVDLILVNKFSNQERAGRGFAPEMLAAMTAGITLLTAVPAGLVEDWRAFTGGRGDLLGNQMNALARWWSGPRLYSDLAQSAPDEAARRVVVGLGFTLVEGPHGIGLARTPSYMPSTPRGGWSGRSLADLAGLARSWDPFDLAVGMAAINAGINRFDLDAERSNGLDGLDQFDPLVVIGGFPGLRGRAPNALVIERQPEPGQYPEEAAEWLLPTAEAVAITASALANRTLPRLLRLSRHAHVALVGPGTPLTPRLFDHGIAQLSGFVATDPEGLVACVAEGGGGRAIKKFGRFVTLRRPAEAGA